MNRETKRQEKDTTIGGEKKEAEDEVEKKEMRTTREEGILIERIRDESLLSLSDEDVLTSHATYPGFIA